MNEKRIPPVVAVFDDRQNAQNAIDELRHAGIWRERIGMATRGEPVKEGTTPRTKVEWQASDVAGGTALAGGGIGAILGAVAVSVIPGLGQILAGGILAGVALGAAGGAAAGALVGPFVSMGLTEDEAHRFDREVRDGRTVVTVDAGTLTGDAVRILERHGARTVTCPAGVCEMPEDAPRVPTGV